MDTIKNNFILNENIAKEILNRPEDFLNLGRFSKKLNYELSEFEEQPTLKIEKNPHSVNVDISFVLNKYCYMSKKGQFYSEYMSIMNVFLPFNYAYYHSIKTDKNTKCSCFSILEVTFSLDGSNEKGFSVNISITEIGSFTEIDELKEFDEIKENGAIINSNLLIAKAIFQKEDLDLDPNIKLKYGVLVLNFDNYSSLDTHHINLKNLNAILNPEIINDSLDIGGIQYRDSCDLMFINMVSNIIYRSKCKADKANIIDALILAAKNDALLSDMIKDDFYIHTGQQRYEKFSKYFLGDLDAYEKLCDTILNTTIKNRKKSALKIYNLFDGMIHSLDGDSKYPNLERIVRFILSHKKNKYWDAYSVSKFFKFAINNKYEISDLLDKENFIKEFTVTSSLYRSLFSVSEHSIVEFANLFKNSYVAGNTLSEISLFSILESLDEKVISENEIEIKELMFVFISRVTTNVKTNYNDREYSLFKYRSFDSNMINRFIDIGVKETLYRFNLNNLRKLAATMNEKPVENSIIYFIQKSINKLRDNADNIDDKKLRTKVNKLESCIMETMI